jgi:alcohol dehydrogenase class IV
MKAFDQARALLRAFKGDVYLYGNSVLKDIGRVVASAGKEPVLIVTEFPGVDTYVQGIRASVEQAGLSLKAVIEGARPNAPREDLARITQELTQADPDRSEEAHRG